jgi:acyl-CoA thioesterase-1
MILSVPHDDFRTDTPKHDQAFGLWPSGFGFNPRTSPMMKRWSALFLVPLSLGGVLGPGCASAPKARVERQIGEAMIFIGEDPAGLAYLPARGRSVRLRSTYVPEAGTVEYLEGRDFTVDYASGTLRRTPTSRIPDFRKNVLFGQKGFDHSKFPGYGNGGYFAFADYSLARSEPWPLQATQADFLKSTRAKLKAGQAVKIVAFGDSITAGGEASKPKLIFWERWANDLQPKYPRARIVAVNGATGGDTTVQGLQRLQTTSIIPTILGIGFIIAP